jgi:enterochelin esterase-like enzyme
MNTPSHHDFSICSQRLQDSISVEIALPEGYDDCPNKEYTSIYLLDANYFFDEAPGTLDDFLERGEGMTRIVQSLAQSGRIPPSVLIGIGYTEAQRSKYTIDDVASFYAFFADELIPGIESRYRVSRSGEDRVLFGYSGSAHFSTYALLFDVYTGAETFAKVISISGVYDSSLEAYRLEERIFQELDAHAFSGRSLFVAVGADDPKLELLNAHRSFVERLTSRGYTDFRLISTEFPGKGHYDIPEFAFSEGLISLFSERG